MKFVEQFKWISDNDSIPFRDFKNSLFIFSFCGNVLSTISRIICFQCSDQIYFALRLSLCSFYSLAEVKLPLTFFQEYYIAVYLYISRIQGYLLVKIAH